MVFSLKMKIQEFDALCDENMGLPPPVTMHGEQLTALSTFEALLAAWDDLS